MSFSFITPCYNCKHGNGVFGDKSCKDQEIIQKAINSLYQEHEDSHKGAGNINMCCVRLDLGFAKSEFD